MRNKEVVITGAQGTIGSVLSNGLRDVHITPVDLPEVDIRRYEQLVPFLKDKDAIIHLAWNTNAENSNNKGLDPGNTNMFVNVYRACLENDIPRVIVASSVHADNYYRFFHDHGEGELMSPNVIYYVETDSPYGKHKRELEEEGRKRAKQGLEVICIRFGGVNPQNVPSQKDEVQPAVWLSHADCVGLVEHCLGAEKVPDNFVIVYGVSNNARRIHDTSNPFGWKP